MTLSLTVTLKNLSSVFAGMARAYGARIPVGARLACDKFVFAGMARSYNMKQFWSLPRQLGVKA